MSDQPPLPPGREGSALVHRLVERDAAGTDLIDLSISVVRNADQLPQVAVSTVDLRATVPDTGYSPRGLPSLRRALAAHVTSWGLQTNADQIVVTTGAQQGISAAAACWVRPGDAVVVDDPTYPGALAAFTQAGARVIAVPVDQHGMRVDELDRVLATRPALVYVQSSPHSPTGAVLADARRRRIAALVDEAKVPLVEDLALADLVWTDAPPPVAAHVPDASIAVVGSLSKLFWGGLRVGFVRAPEPLALRFARIKATHDLGTSAVSQLLAEQLLRAIPLPDLRRRQAREFRRRYDALAEALARHLPGWSWREPEGGLSIWVDTGRASEPFAQHALRRGVAVATPGALSASDRHDTHVRLSFAGRPDELEEGVARLAAAWSSFRSA